MTLLPIAAWAHNKGDKNKINTTTNDCGGIMGKSKQVDIFAPSCSAVQLGRKDKPWTGLAGAFVEHQHLLLSHFTRAPIDTLNGPILSDMKKFRLKIWN